ncbi:Zinc finger MYND-type [Penicillium robsamsonii]|uniref:Zinc finger MYND-type n=1 Tax=Penicillium robsamsonii TaxID=1792511 RepID=UPI002547E17C|nr:Zinc finger MYND-type [Penicillium robsamsonii]KAJ5816412.1 Zinc finger MYND-type [Penicillium robsamsonii]
MASRSERDASGKRNHCHFAVKALLGVPGEAVFLANPYNNRHECESRSQISRLSPDAQAKLIVPLLLEAFINRTTSRATTDESLAQAVSRRCQEIGIRRELCDVAVTTAEELRSAEACWSRWSKALVEAMAVLNISDDGVENVEMVCMNCGFTLSMDKPLQPCSRCLQVSYCSRECQTVDAKGHSPECVSGID